MESDFLLRRRISDFFDKACTKPFRMARFVTCPWSITAPWFREVTVPDLWQSRYVWKRGMHHRAHHGPRCRNASTGEVIQQTGDAYIVRPPAHLEEIIVEVKVKCAPSEFQIQANDYSWLGHIV